MLLYMIVLTVQLSAAATNSHPELRDSDSFLRWKRQQGLLANTGDVHNDENTTCKELIKGEGLNDSPYNSSCQFVQQECDDVFELFNYLSFVLCSLEKAQAVGYIILILWLFELLLILSTTVDNFFVPVLQLLSNKLRLPPSIAGMTLLALGNGAPDIFVAFSALQDDDLALVLGALMGAGLFITTVVLGTVLIATPTKTYNINAIDFMRDLLAYVVVLAIIVAVAYDGKVTLAEGICFPILYFLYVGLVVSLSFFKKWLSNYRRKRYTKKTVIFSKKEDEVSIENSSSNSSILPEGGEEATVKEIEHSSGSDSEEKKKYKIMVPVEPKKKTELVGLTMPKGKVKKVIYILEFPFSLLRWLTIPPCSHDGQWSIFHFCFAVFSPIPMSLFLMIVVAQGWSAFTQTVGNSPFPVPVLVVLCVSPLCVVLFFTLSRKKPPHWVMQIVLMVGAFVMSIAWLNVIANEVVSVLQSLGLLVGISTAILGLTVLAIGNSVADWVADTVIARKGKPEMALASCFGAPLITHVLGLSIALLPKLFASPNNEYSIEIHTIGFVHVKLAWIFLGVILLGSAVVFPLFKFNPPKEYSLVLFYVYIVFMLFSVLVETGTFIITLL